MSARAGVRVSHPTPNPNPNPSPSPAPNLLDGVRSHVVLGHAQRTPPRHLGRARVTLTLTLTLIRTLALALALALAQNLALTLTLTTPRHQLLDVSRVHLFGRRSVSAVARGVPGLAAGIAYVLGVRVGAVLAQVPDAATAEAACGGRAGRLRSLVRVRGRVRVGARLGWLG